MFLKKINLELLFIVIISINLGSKIKAFQTLNLATRKNSM